MHICTVIPGFVYTCSVDNRVCTVKEGFVYICIVITLLHKYTATILTVDTTNWFYLIYCTSIHYIILDNGYCTSVHNIKLVPLFIKKLKVDN